MVTLLKGPAGGMASPSLLLPQQVGEPSSWMTQVASPLVVAAGSTVAMTTIETGTVVPRLEMVTVMAKVWTGPVYVCRPLTSNVPAPPVTTPVTTPPSPQSISAVNAEASLLTSGSVSVATTGKVGTARIAKMFQ